MNHIPALNVTPALANQHVFLTGTTGFLGKAILEKLLREVPDIGQVYVLVRAGKGLDAQSRYEQAVQGSSLFDRLRSDLGAGFDAFMASKITVIDGEITEPCFGLAPEAFARLASRLNLIINSAASVNFREALDQALSINTLCLKNIVALSKAAGSIPVMQISTCYVNGFNRGLMHEQLVTPASGLIPRREDGSFEVQNLIADFSEKIEHIYARYAPGHKREHKLIQLGTKMARHYGWNDTYTLTKWMGEQLLVQELNKQNLTILRPSIIEGSWQGPMPGWVEGVKVADAMIYAYAKGRVSVFPGDDKGIIDVIPVDLVANAALLASAQLMQEKNKFHIYQCCSGSRNPIRLGDFIDLLQEESQRSWEKLPKLFNKKPEHKFQTVTLQRFGLYMTALRTFTWLRTVTGRVLGSSKAGDLMRKTVTTSELAVIFGFYTAPKYRFESTQLELLQQRFSLQDQMTYNIKADCYDWATYLQQVHLPGLHKYALADKKELPKVMAKNKAA